MIERKEYLEQLFEWKDEKVIKVVTGIRRCGKSTLLELYRNKLIEQGVPSDCIVSVNLEDLENERLLDYRALYDYLSKRLCGDRMTYIFLDEIQKVAGFEKAVDSLYIKNNVDLYITGSNAYLLSSELATLLSGRYVEIKMLPFSFKEFLLLHNDMSTDEAFSAYLIDGAFPYVSVMSRSREKIDMYLEGIYNTVIIKDIEERQSRGETDPDKRKITDMALLKRIAGYLASVIGNPVSVKGIADYITSSGRKISHNTVSDYIDALVEPFVFYSAARYDILGKQMLKQGGKYYIVDLGLRRHLLAKREYDLGFSLENIVFLELLRRGYSVNIGKIGVAEVDFVARRGDNISYIQVTASLADAGVFERELAPLRKISDNYGKTVITADRLTLGNYSGIDVVNIIDWLTA